MGCDALYFVDSVLNTLVSAYETTRRHVSHNHNLFLEQWESQSSVGNSAERDMSWRIQVIPIVRAVKYGGQHRDERGKKYV
jgi:hypothetical protein